MKHSVLSSGLALLTTLVFVPATELRAENPYEAFKEDPRRSGKEDRMSQWRSWRYGLFIHWGPYSKLGGTYDGKAITGNTEWIMRSAKIPREEYRKVAKSFDPQHYDPVAIVSFAKEAGFRYIILTAKHYDGFALFDSNASDFDAVDLLPSKRDLVKEFAKACGDAKMPLGFSYSLNMDWYHPGADTLGSTWDVGQKGSKDNYFEKIALPQVQELTHNYGKVAVMMFDNGRPPFPALASRFIEAVGTKTACSFDFTGRGRGDYLYTDINSSGKYYHLEDWEKCTSASDSWGYRKEPANWKDAESLLRELVTTASRGGNYLLNIGLDGEGGIPPEGRERLSSIGAWLVRYGDSIYGTSRSPFTRHTWKGGATLRDRGGEGSTVYLHFFENPGKELILPDLITQPQEANQMGAETSIPVSGRPGAWKLDLSALELTANLPVVEVKLPSRAVIGPGPICSDQEGNYSLSPGRAVLSGSGMSVGRTESSSDLRITGFANASDRATWEVYAYKSAPLKLTVEGLPEVVSIEKKLVLSINGKELETFGLEPIPEEASGPTRRIRTFSSPTFRLTPGLNKITVSGAADAKGKAEPLVALRVRLQKL